MIKTITEKHKFQNKTKTITATIEDGVFATIDVFHFENAINNMIEINLMDIDQ